MTHCRNLSVAGESFQQMSLTVRNYLFLDAAAGSRCDSWRTVKNYLGLNAAAAGGKLGADGIVGETAGACAV
jgi:hypothetical protein